jgi:hypothetical protein
MMLLNVGGQTSTIQFIISVIPIDTFDRSAVSEKGCAGLVREHEGIRACTAVPILSAGRAKFESTFRTDWFYSFYLLD